MKQMKSSYNGADEPDLGFYFLCSLLSLFDAYLDQGDIREI